MKIWTANKTGILLPLELEPTESGVLAPVSTAPARYAMKHLSAKQYRK